MLRRAKAERKPYHVVHFDGHGIYADLTVAGHVAQILQKLFPVIFSAPRTGQHGFLLFENPQIQENLAPIDGTRLGNLLVETDVSVLVLNACRSAHAEVEDESEPTNRRAADEPQRGPGGRRSS